MEVWPVGWLEPLSDSRAHGGRPRGWLDGMSECPITEQRPTGDKGMSWLGPVENLKVTSGGRVLLGPAACPKTSLDPTIGAAEDHLCLEKHHSQDSA
ncbi:hypothetical protein NDU88_002123 [Pleurodeles waltl]|uniref:Uncharacterized protein n=1 Tax=Pleurodeles waltl TaxID=8319 RepID=A0AAV7UUP0_PLEWA|nr:hypothetical protein NDU88_002123 [Pleurodeles waltl]